MTGVDVFYLMLELYLAAIWLHAYTRALLDLKFPEQR